MSGRNILYVCAHLYSHYDDGLCVATLLCTMYMFCVLFYYIFHRAVL